MYHPGPGLTSDKTNELQRALSAAGPEVLQGNITLEKFVHPLTRELGYTAPLFPPATDANLIIYKHKETGIVQFVFPVHASQLLFQGGAGLANHSFAFIRPLQFGLPIANISKWVGTALKIPLMVAEDAIDTIALVVEKEIKPNEGFIKIPAGYKEPATKEDLKKAKGKVLLFVHGIFSSINAAFSELGDPKTYNTTMNTLVKAYSGQVFGYDHWTISKTPLTNALDLLDAIPDNANWDIDVVCHSRGGLVVRSLAYVLKSGKNPVNSDLMKVVSKRGGKIRSIGKTIFVAAANQGSPLADPDEIRDFLNMAAFLASTTECFALDVVIGLARTLVAAGFDLPSVQELATTSTLVSDLNQAKSIISNKNVYGARADFDYNQSVLLNAGAVLDKLLMRVDNDLVVPYAGVASPNPNILANRLLNFGSPRAKQGKVWHTEFFSQPNTHTFLTSHLP